MHTIKRILFVLFIITCIQSCLFISCRLVNLITDTHHLFTYSQWQSTHILLPKTTTYINQPDKTPTPSNSFKWIRATFINRPFLTVATFIEFNKLKNALNALFAHIKTACLNNTACPPEFYQTYHQSTDLALFILTGILEGDQTILKMLHIEKNIPSFRIISVLLSLNNAGTYTNTQNLSQGYALFEDVLKHTQKLFNMAGRETGIKLLHKIYAAYTYIFDNIYQEKDNLNLSDTAKSAKKWLH